MEYIFDIETVPDIANEEVNKLLYAKIKPDGRVKNEDAIEESRQKRWVEAQESFGLSPLTGRIICFSVALGNKKEIRTKMSEDEGEVLYFIQRTFNTYMPLHDMLIGFYIKQFDIPYIMTRFALHGLSLPEINLNKYDQKRVFDLAYALTGFESFGMIAQRLWAAKFGIPVKCKLEGDEVASAFYDKRFEEIIEKNREDVSISQDIFYKLLPTFDRYKWERLQSLNLLEEDIIQNNTAMIDEALKAEQNKPFPFPDVPEEKPVDDGLGFMK